MQPTLVTSRYADFSRARPALGGQILTPVRISVGLPKFAPQAAAWPRCSLLVPWNLLGITDWNQFETEYRRRLDKHGPETIAESLTAIWRQHGENPLALCCFEPAGEFCHRRIFAAWWLEQTGQAIDELEPAIEPAPRLF